jgi:hypothetical protein
MTAHTFDKTISESSNRKSHTFPALPDTMTCPSSDSPDSQNHFQPLFGDGCIHETFAPPAGYGGAQCDDNQVSEDQIRQKGFERGFDSGKQDACRMAQQEIAPEAKTFALEFSQLSEYLEQIGVNSCRQVFKMALAIAAKIIGAEPDLETKGIDSLTVDLKNDMVKSYQLKLMLNPDDMDTLSELMVCENPHWQEYDFIKIGANPQVQRGALLTPPTAEPISSDGTLMGSLENMLEMVSTK